MVKYLCNSENYLKAGMGKLDNYLLFLDELKPNHIYKHLCLGGCAVKESDYTNTVIPFVNNLKRDVFGNEAVILHEVEIRRPEDPIYTALKNAEKRKALWDGLSDLFSREGLLTTLAVSVNCGEYKRLYHCGEICDEYFVALQIVLENFIHFLEVNNAVGSVLVESRNPVENVRLQNHFYTLKASGTLFFSRNAFQKRLSTISFPLKVDNNIGLQLADFVPNPLARQVNEIKQQKPNLHSCIVNKLYDGRLGMSERFGFKNIP